MPDGWDTTVWETLLGRIEGGDVTPVLGAGASADIVGGTDEITGSWAEQMGYPTQWDHSLGTVAQYVATTRDRASPGEHIQRHMSDLLRSFVVADIEDRFHPYRYLPRRSFPVWLTTNYDDLVERSLRAVNKEPRIGVATWTPPDLVWDSPRADLDGFEPTVDEPLVFHLHGRYDDVPSMVITETDYLEFLEQMIGAARIIPDLVTSALATTSLLFIGYSLSDVNLQLMLRSWRLHRAAYLVRPVPSWLDADDVEAYAAYYPRYLRDVTGADVRVFWGTGHEFCAELDRRTGGG